MIKYIDKIHPFNNDAMAWFYKDVLTQEQRNNLVEVVQTTEDLYNELKKSNNDFLIKEYNCLFEISVEKLN